MTAPINLLYLIRTWEFGGSHTILLSLLEHLPRDRFNIICVPYDAHTAGDTQFIAQAERRGLTIADDRVPWKTRGKWREARATVDVLIRKHEINLIHTHDPHSNMLIGLGRSRWRVPVVASAYGWWDGLRPLRRRFHQWIENEFALPNFDRVITVSEDMHRRIRQGRTPDLRIRVIHTGLDPASGADPAAREAFRDRFGIPRDAIVMGTIGRVSAEKGHRHLIDAARILFKANPSARLLIVGDGPALVDVRARAMKAGISNRTVFTGFVEHRDAALSAMDVFVQASTQREGLPTAILEAQRAGLPVVATDIGGTRETFEPKVTGLLVPPGSACAIADTAQQLIDAPDKRAAMGAAAKHRIAQRFTMEGMVDKVSRVYDEAIGHFLAKRNG